MSASALRTARIAAVLFGVLGTILAVLAPLLPVKQTTSTLSWPQQGTLSSVDAPLVSYTPLSMTASVPCSVLAQLPAEGGTVLSTIPSQSPDAERFGMAIRATPEFVLVISRSTVLLALERARLGECSQLWVDMNKTEVRTEFTGVVNADGLAVSDTRDPYLLPQIVGIYTDLEGSAPEGLSVVVEIDSRFSSVPSLLKWLAIVVGSLSTLLALLALNRLDGTDGRRHRRFLPARWWKLTKLDGLVVLILGGWHVMGANTADDGYILNMARSAGPSGYMANYYRWFGVPEAPFGWFYDVTALLTRISTASPWVRLPTLIAGVLCWWVISREVIPRLGRRARRSGVANWAAAAMFLAFWLPFNNGLRPEPIIAVGALLTWCSVERSIATSRLLPAAVAVILAAFSLGAGPTGLMAVAALIAGSRPLLAIVIKRAKTVGYLPLLAPIAASGTLLLFVIFRDQTLAGVLEATRLRGEVGPSLKWYEEFYRYIDLFGGFADGALSRRFPVLMMFLCLFTVIAMLIRQSGLPGVAVRPASRIAGVAVGSVLFLTLTPTKWTHHFGAFAGIAAALAALASLAVTSEALRSPRNRVLFSAVVSLVLAYSLTGWNSWWYVSYFGVPWMDRPPIVMGVAVANLLFAGAMLLLLIAALLHYLELAPHRSKRASGLLSRLTAAPIAVAASIVVVFEVVSLSVGAVSQYPAYSVARSNWDALTGSPCGLADDVLVESDPSEGLLTPAGGIPVADALGAELNVGFTPNGVERNLRPSSSDGEEVAETSAADTSEASDDEPTTTSVLETGTAEMTDSAGVNGSTVPLPFGLLPSTTPVLGSYRDGPQQETELISAWYELPERSAERPLLILSAAGRIASDYADNKRLRGQWLQIEFGREAGPGNAATDFDVLGSVRPMDIGPAPAWRNLRVPMDTIPAEATAVRIVAVDRDLDPGQWLAVTPPRAPKLSTLNEVVGSTVPVLLDWPVGLGFPCQRPFRHLYGVAEVPQYRITGDRSLTAGATVSQGNQGGGPVGWIALMVEPTSIPTYLRDDWGREWGSLERYTPFNPDTAPAEREHTTVTRSGLWSPGPVG